MPFECLYKPSGDLCNLFGSEVVKYTRVHGDRRLRTESAWSRFEDRLELRCSSEGFRFRLSREDAVCGGGMWWVYVRDEEYQERLYMAAIRRQFNVPLLIRCGCGLWGGGVRGGGSM